MFCLSHFGPAGRKSAHFLKHLLLCCFLIFFGSNAGLQRSCCKHISRLFLREQCHRPFLESEQVDSEKECLQLLLRLHLISFQKGENLLFTRMQTSPFVVFLLSAHSELFSNLFFWLPRLHIDQALNQIESEGFLQTPKNEKLQRHRRLATFSVFACHICR